MSKKKAKFVSQNRGAKLLDRHQRALSIMKDMALHEGVQRMFDFIVCVLHDPEVMGNDTFGPKRIEKIKNALHERDKYYSEAFTAGKNADVLQEELDREILDAVGKENFCPFTERHPDIIQVGYDKAKKGWVDSD